VAAVALATTRPGTLSLDAALGLEVSGWAGLIAAPAGVPAGAVQLALT
jgi:hypothetical protein